MEEMHSENRLIDKLPEELRNEPALKDFKDEAALAKSYLHQSKLIGASVRIPNENSSSEDIQNFINKVTTQRPELVKVPNTDEEFKVFKSKIGVPEKIEDYKIELSEELQSLADDQTSLPILEMAHKMGLTNNQAKVLAEKFLTEKQNNIKSQEEFTKKSEETLRKLWGAAYDQRLEGVTVAAKSLMNSVEGFDDFLKSDSAKHPAVAIMLAEIAKNVKEGNAILGKNVVKYNTLTPDEALDKISEIKKTPNHPVYDARHPEHRREVEKMAKLYEAAFPEQGQATAP